MTTINNNDSSENNNNNNPRNTLIDLRNTWHPRNVSIPTDGPTYTIREVSLSQTAANNPTDAPNPTDVPTYTVREVSLSQKSLAKKFKIFFSVSVFFFCFCFFFFFCLKMLRTFAIKLTKN